jgi:hypothetical protein
MAEPSTVKTWSQTGYDLCYVNCGIEAITEGAPHGQNPRRQGASGYRGYAGQKSQGLDYYKNQADRVTTL